MKREAEAKVAVAKRVSVTRRSQRILAKVSATPGLKQEETELELPPTPARSGKPTPDASISPDEPKIKVEYECLAKTSTQTTTTALKTELDGELYSKSISEQGSDYPPIIKSELQAVVSPSSKARQHLEYASNPKQEDEVPPNVFPPYQGELEEGQPANWIEIYNEIVRMRALITTPVDNMGCGRMPTSLMNNSAVLDRRTFRFQLLIALMLSSQTRDETNFAAMTTLHEHYRAKGYPGLCLDAVLALTEEEIDKCISKVGFHTRKAMYIRKACEMLAQNFNGDVPQTIEEVVSLPGVGPKMGHLLLQNGWDINLGIGVDVHIHRLAQMWGWVPKTDKPEVTRSALEDWLPQQVWADINPLLVGFGQTVCPIKANSCDVCTLSDGLCEGVNKKLARTPLTEKRIQKISKLRGNLDGLVSLRMAKDLLEAERLSSAMKKED